MWRLRVRVEKQAVEGKEQSRPSVFPVYTTCEDGNDSVCRNVGTTNSEAE